jgi:hypothetical protein
MDSIEGALGSWGFWFLLPGGVSLYWSRFFPSIIKIKDP